MHGRSLRRSAQQAPRVAGESATLRDDEFQSGQSVDFDCHRCWIVILKERGVCATEGPVHFC
jgi:hypothetical protein